MIPTETTLSISYQALLSALPQEPMFRHDPAEPNRGVDPIGWQVSPEPYWLSPEQQHYIDQLGPTLAAFALAIQRLYRYSLKNPGTHGWVSDLFEANKPEGLVKFSLMNRFKSQYPIVIRPDLLVTTPSPDKRQPGRNPGLSLCEIDAVPGGLGFTAALSMAYQTALEQATGQPLSLWPENTPATGMIARFIAALRSLTPDNPTPTIAIVVSDEAQDYLLEWRWLAKTAKALGLYQALHVVHPSQLRLRDQVLGFVDDDTDQPFQAIDLVYRFFELFDLPNITNIELIELATKKGWVTTTPPFKSFLEEKLVLALIHAPQLAPFWTEQLGLEGYELLLDLVPQSWILDPSPIPPHAAVTPAMVFADTPFRTFEDLANLTQKQRRLVIKPSGFSPLAWGSRGVTIGHDVPQTEWQAALQAAMADRPNTPHLLQRYDSPTSSPYRYFDPASHEVKTAEGRTRLCPYYILNGESVSVAGILATTCPKNKKVIHGMADGVLRPAFYRAP
ncbi:MAG: hypothetical protein KC475_12440 [Cyanobacteria bacterium HKST-UBA03]|nr:hypothetical protein [Cyanobacteria bacterium HKST-UBA03]